MLGRLLLVLLLGLAGCGSTRLQPTGTTLETGGALSCVPYARARSGLALRGDAWQWWEAAAPRYERSRVPQPGSILVLMRTSRLPMGHVAVVSRLVSDREIRVDHANWAPGGTGNRGRVARDQAVADVSPGNDWSIVKVWYPPSGALGATPFPAYGFVHPRMVTAGR